MNTNPIENFFLAFDSTLKNVTTLKSTNYQDNFKKIVLFSLFDMLSKGIYGSVFDDHRNKHRIKFVTFVSQFCEWEYAETVSLQQLVLALSKDVNPMFEELRVHLNKLISTWPRSKPITLDYDPSYDQLLKFWPKGEKIEGKMSLDYFKHINLFYSLRNSFVHESRPLGYSFELFDEKEPHYISRGVLKRDEQGNLVDLEHEAFELIHPVEFFFTLLENAIRNGKIYCEENGLNPYDHFKFSSEWL